MMQTMTRRTQESLCSFHISAAVLIAAAMLTYSNARAEPPRLMMGGKFKGKMGKMGKFKGKMGKMKGFKGT